MLGRMREGLMPFILRLMAKRLNKLTGPEMEVADHLLKEVSRKPTTLQPTVLVAMVGLVGSGKSAVARELARHIKASVVEGDAIRVELRKRKMPFDHIRAIGEYMAIRLVKQGWSVVLDSDFADTDKRESVREVARRTKTRLAFIRVICEYDIILGRIVSANYGADDLFGSAQTSWKGPSRGAVVKMREMWRRTPLHYRWESRGGGRWIPRAFPFRPFAVIDTTRDDEWKDATKKLAARL